jgi:cobalt/nickel transport system permease protein
MHLGNGAITPECVVLTFGAAAAGLAAATGTARRAGLTGEKLQRAAALGALVFAAQAVNVPVLPGVSGHFVGGVLLAWLLGEGLGAWTMAVVLAAQALVGDGGTLAFGANVLNMAILPAVMVALSRRLANRPDNMPRSQAILAATAFAALPLAALLIGLETAFFRTSGEVAGWTQFVTLLVGVHLVIGALEAALTVAVVYLASFAAARLERQQKWGPALVGAAIVVATLAVILPLSSILPDGYEAAAMASGMGWLLGG